MTNKQSEALRIADLLGKEIHRTVYVDVLHQNAINELRRLHEVNAELVEVLKRIKLEQGFMCECGIEPETWDLIEEKINDGN